MRRMCRFAVSGLFLWAASLAMAQTAPPAPAQPAPAKKGLEFEAGDFKIKFYGFVRFDAHYDDSHPNNTQLIGVIKPEADLPLPSSSYEEEDSSDLTMHARNTRFGIDVTGPVISELGDAAAMGKIEFDFLANGGSEAVAISRGVIRMRQAYLKLGWSEFSVLAGQTWDVAAPLIPTVNGEFLLWGAGNLGDRRPMLRADCLHAMGDMTLILQGEAGLTGACANEDSDTNGIRDGESATMPTLQGRAAVKMPSMVDKKPVEIGGWVHYAKEHLDKPAAGMEDDFISNAYGVDATVPLLDFLDVRGEAWQGKNLDDVRGGIFQGTSDVDNGTEIEARGYWGEILLKPCDVYTFGVGASCDNPANEDLSTTISISPIAGAQANKVLYVANRFKFGALLLGLDYLNWTTVWAGVDVEGEDNRVSFFAQYNF